MHDEPYENGDRLLTPARNTNVAAETLPADLEPVHQRLLDDSAGWSRRLPAADPLAHHARTLPMRATRTAVPMLEPDTEHDGDDASRATAAAMASRWPHDSSTGGQPPSRRQPIGQTALALVATVLVVALLASVLTRLGQNHTKRAPAVMPTATAAATATPAPACPPDEVQASLPPLTTLLDLAMTSPGTGWAVGSVSDGNFSVQNPQGTSHSIVLRLADCHWAPYGSSLPNVSFWSISMVSPNEGWMTGDRSHMPLLFHYTAGATGSTWSQVDLAPMGAVSNLGLVRALPSGEIWIASGDSGTSAGSGIVLLHRAGGTWTRIPINVSEVDDIGPVGPGDVWIIGHSWPSGNTSVPELAHLQGGTITQVITLNPRNAYTRLRMFAPNDGWALGVATVSGNETSADPTVTRPLALHYNGSQWTETDTGVSPSARQIDVLGPGMAWAYTTAVPDPSRGEFIVSTQREFAGSWTNVAWPFKDVRTISHITCVTPDDCWALGEYALPNTTRTNPDGSTYIVINEGWLLLRYANGAWHQYGHA